MPRAYLNIWFYEWRHEANELIIAGTSEQLDNVVNANRHYLGGVIHAFNHDFFEKYTFLPDGMQLERYRFHDFGGEPFSHLKPNWFYSTNLS